MNQNSNWLGYQSIQLPIGQSINYPGIQAQVYRGVGVLNIIERKANLEYSINVSEQEINVMKKDLEYINNLHPATLNIIKIANKLVQSNKIEDINELDKYVRDLLFSIKLKELCD